MRARLSIESAIFCPFDSYMSIGQYKGFVIRTNRMLKIDIYQLLK